MKIGMTDRIGSRNAAQAEKNIPDRLAGQAPGYRRAIAGQSDLSLEFDASGLTYIPSSGLRILLRIRKSRPDMRIMNETEDE